jgi:cystathionine beta-lyase
METNFDEIIDRKKTKSIKYDFSENSGRIGYNLIPLTIADMDFRTAPSVRKALAERVEHGIFGYSGADYRYFEAVSGWQKKRFDWEVKEEWLVRSNGVLNALSIIFNALTFPSDGILIQYPSYGMFNLIIERTNHKIVPNPLILKDGRYEIDYDDFEKKILRNNVKLFVLCNPNNPVGRVFTGEELTRMGDICLKHQVTVVSDEIHEDIIYPGHKHTVFASLNYKFERHSIICTSPSKTFNLAGLPVSNIFIPEEELRDKINDEIALRGALGTGLLEMIACEAAYAEGAEWVDALNVYLDGNRVFAGNFLREKIPEISLIEPEGTFLLWIDFRALGFWGKELEAFIADEAQVQLNTSPGGEGFLRVNIACPRSILKKAFARIEQAVRKLKG